MMIKAIKETNKRLWLTDGASMVYPNWTRNLYWAINLCLYALLNMFILRLQRGIWIDLEGPFQSKALIPTLLSPLNIFQFPSYIFIIALLMAMVCTVPILIAQLYNFLYSIPFFFLVFFLSHNPMLMLSLSIACLIAGFEPLRFKSKFVAAVMCLIPVVLYWWMFSGNNPEQDIRRWAVLYAPWVFSALFSICQFGLVLTIGHFVRYRPGVLMPLFGLVLAGTVVLFNQKIGMEERDFQADVYRFSPGQITEFETRSIASLLEKELAQRRLENQHLSPELITAQLRTEWRWAFKDLTNITNLTMTDSLDRNSLANQEANKIETAWLRAFWTIGDFIEKNPKHERVADALYYQALFLDMKVDARLLRDKDILRFYYHIPSVHSIKNWENILSQFGSSKMAIEACYRLAILKASQKPELVTDRYHFNEALQLLEKAKVICNNYIQAQAQEKPKPSFWEKHLGAIFANPPYTISTADLLQLKMQIEKMIMYLSPENQGNSSVHHERLSEFIKLDSNQLNFESQLRLLLTNAPDPDPIRDNIGLSLSLLETDVDQKIALFKELIQQYPETDGGIEAHLELAQIYLNASKASEHQGERQHLHEQAQTLLKKVMIMGRDGYPVLQAQKLIKDNPLN